MKFKLQAGAELDLLTRDEMRAELQAWLDEIKRGVRFVQRTYKGTVNAGAVLIDDPDAGPAGSFCWAVTRVSVAGLTMAETVNVYLNDVAPSNFVCSIGATPGRELFGSTGLLLNPLNRVIFAQASGLAGTEILVGVQSVELPVQLAWQLIG